MVLTVLLEVKMTSFRIGGKMESKRLRGQMSLRVCKGPTMTVPPSETESQMAAELPAHPNL